MFKEDSGRGDEKAPSHPFLKTTKVHSRRRHSSLVRIESKRRDLDRRRVRSSPGKKETFSPFSGYISPDRDLPAIVPVEMSPPSELKTSDGSFVPSDSVPLTV